MLDLTQDIQSLTTFFRRAGDSMKRRQLTTSCSQPAVMLTGT
jgi:hypothetical protein